MLQSVAEARCLADQVELYYSLAASPGKLELLQRFTHQPTTFQHEDLITELNNIQLGPAASSSIQ